MSDISMCRGELDGQPCSLKTTCLRHESPANPEWQAYLLPLAVGQACALYWPITGPLQRPLPLET